MTALGRRAGNRVAVFLDRTVRIGGRDVPMAVIAPLFVAVVVRVVFAFTDNIVGPDEAAYLATGRNIWSGRGITYRGNPQLHFPPLLPIVLGAIAKVTPEPHHATVVLTFVSGVALVGVLGALAWRVSGRRAGVIVLWVAALSPGLSASVTRGAGGSEAPYTFLVFAAALVAIGRSADDPPSLRRSFIVGFLVGAAYLVRPEGIALIAVFGLILAVRAIGGRVRRNALTVANLRRVAALALACAAGLLVIAVPYVAFLHSHSGKWELTAKSVDVNIEAWRDLSAQDRAGRDTYLYALSPDGLSTRHRQYSLSALAKAHPRAYLGIVGENVKQLYKSLISLNTTAMPGWRVFALPLLPFALLGLWRYRSRAPVLAVGGILALSIATVLGFFVLNRYLAPAVAALAVLAGIGVADLAARPRRWWVAIGLIASLCSVLTYFEGAHGPAFVRERPDLQVAARWMRGRVDAHATVMTRSTALPYYLPTNRLLVPPVTDVAHLYRFAQYHHARYFIFDPPTQLWRPDLRALLDGRDHSDEGFKTLHTVRVEDRTTVIFEVVPTPAA